MKEREAFWMNTEKGEHHPTWTEGKRQMKDGIFLTEKKQYDKIIDV